MNPIPESKPCSFIEESHSDRMLVHILSDPKGPEVAVVGVHTVNGTDLSFHLTLPQAELLRDVLARACSEMEAVKK